MIRGNAMTNTKNPPGQFTNEIKFTNQTFDKENPKQVKYLRDVIKKYYDQEALEVGRATQPSTDAEKRLERLKTALLGLCRSSDGVSQRVYGVNGLVGVDVSKILKILEDNA